MRKVASAGERVLLILITPTGDPPGRTGRNNDNEGELVKQVKQNPLAVP